MNLLEVNNICKTYGSGEAAVQALKSISFSVPKGEYVTIVGESGSGKSTLLNMIGALDAPTSGKVTIDGKDIFAMNDRKLTIFRRRNIGFIFQSFNLIPELTVEQNIIFPVLLDYQKPDKRYLEELLTVLNLNDRHNHLPSQLSGGQQQRAAIGRAFITRPSLILADEPTGNLDTRNSSEVIALLKEASKKYEQTIIMITHSRSIAQTADRVLQVSDGMLTDLGRCPGFLELFFIGVSLLFKGIKTACNRCNCRLCFGEGGESRTHVRKHFHGIFSERSWWFKASHQ